MVRNLSQFGLVIGGFGVGVVLLLAGGLRLRGAADLVAFWVAIGFSFLALVSAVLLFFDGVARLLMRLTSA